MKRTSDPSDDHVFTGDVCSKSYKIKRVNFYDTDCAMDCNHFPPLPPSPLNVSLETLVTGPDFFHANSEDVFNYSTQIINRYPAVLPTLSLAAKIATAHVLSAKFRNLFEQLVCELHTACGEKRVELMNEFEDVRFSQLIKGRFEVVSTPMKEGVMGGYDRHRAREYPRRIEVNSKFFDAIEMVALDPLLSNELRRLKLKKYALFLAIILSKESGGHCSHSMARFHHFFDSEFRLRYNNGQQATSPVRGSVGTPGYDTADFGAALQYEYYFYSIPILITVADSFEFDIDQIGFNFPEFEVTLRYEIYDADFCPKTYESGGMGMCASLNDPVSVQTLITCKVAIDARRELAAVAVGDDATSSSSSSGPSGISSNVDATATGTGTSSFQFRTAVTVPPIDEYKGDMNVKLRLIHTPAPKPTQRSLKEHLAKVERGRIILTMQGQELRPVANSLILSVGGSCEDDCKRH